MTNYDIYPLPLTKVRLSEGFMTYFTNYYNKEEIVIHAWYGRDYMTKAFLIN